MSMQDPGISASPEDSLANFQPTITSRRAVTLSNVASIRMLSAFLPCPGQVAEPACAVSPEEHSPPEAASIEEELRKT
jgi:hypothetical protein